MVGKSDNHPRYPNSTLVEAIVEVFLENQIDSSCLNKIFIDFKARYPIHTQDEIVSYMATIENSGIAIEKDKKGLLRLQFRNNDILIQIFANRLLVHWLAKYNGWEYVQQRFQETWVELSNLVPNLAAQRIGVRFINKLDSKKINQPLSKWLKTSPHYPKNLLASKTNFFYRGQWNIDTKKISENRLAIITIAEGQVNTEARPLMFDIDVIAGLSKSQKKANRICEIADELHEHIWQVFSESISLDYLKHLNRKS